MKKQLSRRQVLQDAAGGLGAIALSSMMCSGNALATSAYDLTPKKPHFAPKAKNVIFIYVSGGPSTIDMFDPKPVLNKFDGKPAPFEIKGRALNGSQQIMASPWQFRRSGQTGRPISELLPQFAKVVDEVAFVRSMSTDRVDHSTAQFSFVTGRGITGFPTIGSWIAYGLGTENQNLPAYIALENGQASIQTRAYSSAWLPPLYSGTRMSADAGAPMFDIQRPNDMPAAEQEKLLQLVKGLNRRQKQAYPLDQELESRIANYELAARMQLEAMKVADVSKESAATRQLYGVDDPITGPFGANCLMARRLVESGVRFVSLINARGAGTDWDNHNNIRGQLPGLCQSIDQGMYGLLTDLKARGLLDSTLVVWSGEFGRLPTIEANIKEPGRDHNPYGFCLWMAGGGVKAGVDFGATDELGYAADPSTKLTHSDIHATIQHLVGLDYQRNTYVYEGRHESLVGINAARVVKEILS